MNGYTFQFTVSPAVETKRPPRVTEGQLFTLMLVRDMLTIPEMEQKIGKSRQVVQRRLAYLVRDELAFRETWPGTNWTRRYVITEKGKEVLREYHINPNPDPQHLGRHGQDRSYRTKLKVEAGTAANTGRKKGAVRNTGTALAGCQEEG